MGERFTSLLKKSWASFAQLFRFPVAARKTVVFLFGVTLLLAACTRSLLPADEGFFIAPTIVGGSEAIILETLTPLPATATPECDNNLVFLRDITVPDGTHFAAGATIEKSWELRNDGTCAWIHGYTVELQENSNGLGAIPRQPLPEAAPGESIVLTIQFTAPNVAGTYTSLWKAHALGGEPFGVGIYVEIVVD